MFSQVRGIRSHSRLFAYFEENEEFFLVQELIEGHDLIQEFQAGRRWSEAETVRLLQELLSILSVVHQQDVIHRDRKPANIMRSDRDGKLVLIDFGAALEALAASENSNRFPDPLWRSLIFSTAIAVKMLFKELV